MNNIQQQQKYTALAFVYWDNREFVDLLDGTMFWEYAPVISIVKNHSTMDDIWKYGLNEWCMWEMIECDLDVAMHYRINAWRELLRLWEMWIDNKFKNWKTKLDRWAVKKITELYDKLQKRLEGSNENNILAESRQYIEMAKEKTGVKTWLAFLDNHIGWLRSGTITRVNGYSNVGKSRFMYRVMVNILKQGKSIHLMSLEVPKWMVLLNLVGAYYGINTSSVEFWHHDDKLQDFYDMFHDKCLIEDDKMSLDEIEASVIHNDKDVIFIDYVQNIRANGKDEYERMSRIAQELQKMAITTKKVFFDLSQVSNEWAKTYKVWDMIPSKWSGAFVHACDVGLVLHKWEEKNRMYLSLAKNKFGEKDIQYTLESDMGKCEFKFLVDNSF